MNDPWPITFLHWFWPHSNPAPLPVGAVHIARCGTRGKILSEEFLIPESEKQAYLDANYPFGGVPKLSDIKYDLHAEKNFQVRDYILVREDGENFICSPYYYEDGGTAMDWMEPE